MMSVNYPFTDIAFIYYGLLKSHLTYILNEINHENGFGMKNVMFRNVQKLQNLDSTIGWVNQFFVIYNNFNQAKGMQLFCQLLYNFLDDIFNFSILF